MRPHRAILALLYLIAFSALAHYLSEGWSYYRTPLIERPHHPQLWSLKPGGTRGQMFGIIGAGLMSCSSTPSANGPGRCGFFGECLIVAIRFFKHEVSAWADLPRRVKREVTMWKSDP